MQMIDIVRKNNKTKTILAILSEKLPKLFYEEDIRVTLEELQTRHDFSDTIKNRIIKRADNLPFKPTPKSFKKLYSLNKKEISVEEILQVLSTTNRQYISHLSAMYFLGLLDQRPNDYFISREVESKSRSTPGPLNAFNIRQSFLKPARRTKAHAEYLGQKFNLIEKLDLGEVGVVPHQIRFEKKDIELKITSFERTFIDSIISPHYSGGISTIVSAFLDTELKIAELIKIYKVIDPIYPFWQNIGFFLEYFGSKEKTAEWLSNFKDEKLLPFYIAHDAKAFWKFSDKWKIYYPEGPFNAINN